MTKKLFLLDALALIYRAYYALIKNPRMTSKGKNTNAQFGFTNTLYDLMSREKPTHLAVCFDTFAPTERHSDFTEYKANRQETPEDLLGSLDDIKRIIRAFNIPVVELDGTKLMTLLERWPGRLLIPVIMYIWLRLIKIMDNC
jgi:DNA polymerase-1